ncbi:hypothetical protein Clacol_002228 [Clathrus columnatus]|uniref:DSBA-like thioredoxin domain-containing protein n=1 Tax=Clathrus columnatus TaxID=1419009 RepID=A0AAV5A4R7_9AGAM|nr:hypothetical protein Clacol_002228 [Clathrus columnatus]
MTSISTANKEEPRVIKVAIVSDIVCIWCYFAVRGMEIAIEKLQLPPNTPIKFEFEHRPYLLNPTLKHDETISRQEFVKRHYGEDRWESATVMVEQRSKELGINLAPDSMIFNTLNCHRLLLSAWRKGRDKLQQPLLNDLFEALYLRGEDLTKSEVLTHYAAKVGLMTKHEAMEFIRSDDLKAEVQRMAAIAQRNGVTGVPFVLLDGRWVISGSQTEDVYYPLFQKLVDGKDLQ